MDGSPRDEQPPGSSDCAVGLSENAPFLLGTGKLVVTSPQKRAAEATSPLCTPDLLKSPLDFSTVTVEQLGITPESFVKNAAEGFVTGKSPSYLKKSRRRRSAVGARGSPETNHLIRFIAQQRRLKDAVRSPMAHESPFQGSPGLFRNANSLRERISAFRSAFHSIQETEKMTDHSVTSGTDKESKTSGSTRKEGLTEYQQSGFPVNLSTKRRRISSQSSPEDHLGGAEGTVVDTDRAYAVGASADLAEKSSGSAPAECILGISAPVPKFTEASNELEGSSDYVEGTRSIDVIPLDTSIAQVKEDTVPDIGSPATPVYRSDILSPETFVLRSVLKKPSGKLFPQSLQEHQSNLCDDGTRPSSIPNPSECCKEQKPDQEKNKASAFLNVRKRKRVTFGEDLSPEVFDESLPANTPLRKGGTPVRQKDLIDTSPIPPDQSPVPQHFLQPNFDDKGENLENIEPLQISFAVLSPNKSSISETLSGTGTFSSSNNHEKITCEIGRATRASSRRKLMGFAEENVHDSYITEAEPCKEKKINRRRSQGSNCANKVPPKKKQVLKSCRKKKGKGKKGFQKSLYGERDIASKKPLLSPIPELPESLDLTPSAMAWRRIYSDDFNSNDELEDVNCAETPGKRERLLPADTEDVPEHPDCGQSAGSEVCGSLPGTVISEGEPDTRARDTEDDLGAESQVLSSAKEPKTENKNESSDSLGAAVAGEGCVMSDHPKPACVPSKFPGAVHNAEKLCEICKISQDINVKYEKEDACLAAKGQLPCSHLTPDWGNEPTCSEDGLPGNTQASPSHSRNVEREPAQDGSAMNGRGRKHRRHSVCYSDGHSFLLKPEGHAEPYSDSVEISLENPRSCEDLSAAIEQSLQRASCETRVRRSTRLQRDLESTGLIWMALPPSSAQNTKRRTICTSDSRGLESAPSEESVSSQHKTSAPPSPLEESSQRPAAASRLLKRRRRRSCYDSALLSTPSTTQLPGSRREVSARAKGRSSHLPSSHPDTGQN